MNCYVALETMNENWRLVVGCSGWCVSDLCSYVPESCDRLGDASAEG